MSDQFSLETEVHDETLVLKTSGYINRDAGEKIAEYAYEQIDNGVNNIIIDFEDTQIINSIGISILIEIIEKLETTGGKMYFTEMSSTIEKTLRIMGLFQYAEPAEDTSELLGQLS